MVYEKGDGVEQVIFSDSESYQADRKTPMLFKTDRLTGTLRSILPLIVPLGLALWGLLGSHHASEIATAVMLFPLHRGAVHFRRSSLWTGMAA